MKGKITKIDEEWAELNNGSKGSDKTKTNNMKTGTSSLMDSHLVDFSNKNAHLIKSNSTTSSQTEISDEGIEEMLFHHSNEYAYGFKDAIKWYREQLKSRQ